MSFDGSRVEQWLLETPWIDDGGRSFAKELASHLVDAGLPLWRSSVALMTKHPEVLWRTLVWEDGGVDVRDQPHARLFEPYYEKSAVAVARSKRETVDVRLVPGALPYPICEELRERGGTHYFVLPLPFRNGEVGYASFATKTKDGFDSDTRAALERLRGALANRVELESSYYATRGLLEVYLGKNAARRVFDGAFQRGRGELIDAAIWFSDMRGFTAMSDRAEPADVVKTLDLVFDTLATAISAHGGEVLKFIGDAVLAIFPTGANARAACRNALDAAQEALAAMKKLETPLEVGIALHRGRVMYGNIGARDRLDFTVIASAVNEASRLESLCKSLGTNLALSAAFVESAALVNPVDLGEHAVKGVSSSLHVYTVR